MPDGKSNLENEIYEKYKSIQSYEHHFNNLETEIRKLASVWLLATLGAIAYIVKGAYLGDPKAITGAILIAPKLLIPILCFMGTFGLLVLWILDQLVYHRLLNSVFLLGIRMEYQFDFLPPIRTLMMLFSRRRGLARYLRLYYLMPMFFFAFSAVFFSIWYVLEKGTTLGLVAAFFTLLIPVLVYLKSKGMEKYVEIAEGFGDEKFLHYLAQSDYEIILKKNRVIFPDRIQSIDKIPE